MKCPGQDMKYWKADAIFESVCPKCSATIEFYKDDTSRKCAHCGHRMINPQMDFGCASYCQYAEQCLGSLPEDFAGAREQLLKDKVAVEVKRALGGDFRSIRQVTSTARFAEKIGKAEGGNLAIILCAAYLQRLDPATTREILAKVGAAAKMGEEIATLIAAVATPPPQLTIEAKILADALLLQEFDEVLRAGGSLDEEGLARLHTVSAAELAAALGQ